MTSGNVYPSSAAHVAVCHCISSNRKTPLVGGDNKVRCQGLSHNLICWWRLCVLRCVVCLAPSRIQVRLTWKEKRGSTLGCLGWEDN